MCNRIFKYKEVVSGSLLMALAACVVANSFLGLLLHTELGLSLLSEVGVPLVNLYAAGVSPVYLQIAFIAICLPCSIWLALEKVEIPKELD